MSTVLIVDSDTAVAESLKEAFEGRGASVVVTGDGAMALKTARADKPDLIVLCVELSRGSGYSVCNKLKKDAELSSIPLILTSSQATEETFQQHKKLRTRAEAYLKKPYEMDEILQVAGGLITLDDGGVADANELEVSIDDVSVDIDTADQEDDLFDVGVDDDSAKVNVGASPELDDVSLDDELLGIQSDPAPATDSAFRSGEATQVLVASAEADRMRTEIRQLRQKVQRMEQDTQEKELEFNDRLLEESARARDSIDLKKKLGQIEREIGKSKAAAEKAKTAAERSKEELAQLKKDADATESERQVLSEKIGQLVDKVKSLASERDALQTELGALQKTHSELRMRSAGSEKIRAKARKAVDIAVQLIAETGIT
ncbi:MAG: response regulator [Myxococcota bacterium]